MSDGDPAQSPDEEQVAIRQARIEALTVVAILVLGVVLVGLGAGFAFSPGIGLLFSGIIVTVIGIVFVVKE